jgi:protein O-GlcNAc transferase
MSSCDSSVLIKKEQTTQLDPLFSKNDKDMFYKYVSNAANYFEYGSGGSTVQTSLRKNILNIYSVESDRGWYNKIKEIIKKSNIKYVYVEMGTMPNTFGHPGPNSTSDEKINYSEQILLLEKQEVDNIDFILIDGRFRVACCLKCLTVINDNCIIAFDDFLNRLEYHIVLDYCDIIDKTTDNRMVILKKKVGIEIPRELIAKYELIPN